jgi:hypothetical protein
MPTTSSQVSVDGLLAFIASYTVDHFKKTGRRTDGAVLAEAIRTHFPGFSYEQVGLARLSDAVRIAEQRGLVIRHRDVKHLELSPGPDSDLPPGTELTTHTVAPLPHVKPDIWRAFVFVSRGNVFFLDRDSGQVLALREEDRVRHDALEADQQYAKITPIAVGTQQQWMKQFTHGREGLNVDEAPIHAEEWWVEFPAWLRGIDFVLERAWHRFRTAKVLEYLREWASSNNVTLSSLLSPEDSLRQTRSLGPQDSIAETTRTESQRLREAIIAAVGEMPLEQLQDIPIPVRYIIRHFKPR